ncbi:hypothetical protein [Saccharopolyspora elongata]|uniref:hypothetical protein n=1 Tax=Saccharopolyspora elongata TaxID=2530387 RepID=UPI00140485A8|nr:hypothetical protein [Saccharopolyspora elongata]
MSKDSNDPGTPVYRKLAAEMGDPLWPDDDNTSQADSEQNGQTPSLDDTHGSHEKP